MDPEFLPCKNQLFSPVGHESSVVNVGEKQLCLVIVESESGPTRSTIHTCLMESPNVTENPIRSTLEKPLTDTQNITGKSIRSTLK